MIENRKKLKSHHITPYPITHKNSNYRNEFSRIFKIFLASSTSQAHSVIPKKERTKIMNTKLVVYFPSVPSYEWVQLSLQEALCTERSRKFVVTSTA